MPRSNLSSSQKSSADEKVKVAGPSNQHCYSSYTTQPYKWIWTKNKNTLLDAPASTFARLHLPVSTFIHLRPAVSTYAHLHPPVSTCIQLRPPVSTSVGDGTQQNVKRYRYFFRYQIFPISIPVLFLVPNFTNTDSETFFRYQTIPIPVPKPPAKMKNSRYQYLYHYKCPKF